MMNVILESGKKGRRAREKKRKGKKGKERERKGKKGEGSLIPKKIRVGAKIYHCESCDFDLCLGCL